MKFPVLHKKDLEDGEKGSVVVSSTPSSSFSSPQEGVVIADKEVLNLQMFGAMSNGNATIPLSNNKALKFTRKPDFTMGNGKKGYMVRIQVIEAGIGKKIAYQTWNRTKTVKQTVVKEKLVKPKAPLKKFVNEGTEEI